MSKLDPEFFRGAATRLAIDHQHFVADTTTSRGCCIAMQSEANARGNRLGADDPYITHAEFFYEMFYPHGTSNNAYWWEEPFSRCVREHQEARFIALHLAAEMCS